MSQFTVIDHEDEQYGCTTWVRCDACGGVEQVWDRREPEQARNEAESMHVCPPRCVHCDEPMSFGVALSDEPNAIPVHRQCFEDDRPGVRESIMAYLEKQEAA